MAIAAKRASRAKKVEPTISKAAITQTIPRAQVEALKVESIKPSPQLEPVRGDTLGQQIVSDLEFSPIAQLDSQTLDKGRWHMTEFAAIGAVLFAIVIWLAPQKLGSMIYITAKVALFSYLAYWIGRRGLHLRISQIADPILRSQGQIAFALLFAAAIFVAGYSP